MNRENFGALIAALRKEHTDEHLRPWNQQRLAAEANKSAGTEAFSPYIIGNIERGARALDQTSLVALATALRLTSGERKEFFLAASGVESWNIARPENSPEDVLNELLVRMGRTYLPAHINDSYGDVLAVNTAAHELVSLTDAGLGPVVLRKPFPTPITWRATSFWTRRWSTSAAPWVIDGPSMPTPR